MKAMFPILFEKQCTARYPIGLEVMKGAVYTRWREANPEHTLRFYALRLREVGMIKSTPQKLIAQGADWRFLNELKKEGVTGMTIRLSRNVRRPRNGCHESFPGRAHRQA